MHVNVYMYSSTNFWVTNAVSLSGKYIYSHEIILLMLSIYVSSVWCSHMHKYNIQYKCKCMLYSMFLNV